MSKKNVEAKAKGKAGKKNWGLSLEGAYHLSRIKSGRAPDPPVLVLFVIAWRCNRYVRNYLKWSIVMWLSSTVLNSTPTLRGSYGPCWAWFSPAVLRQRWAGPSFPVQLTERGGIALHTWRSIYHLGGGGGGEGRNDGTLRRWLRFVIHMLS